MPTEKRTLPGNSSTYLEATTTTTTIITTKEKGHEEREREREREIMIMAPSIWEYVRNGQE